jgi:hypothetical protein
MAIKTEGIKVKANGKLIGCLDDIGTITMSRDRSEKKCLTDGSVRYILDSIKTGDLDISVSYDPTDTAGAQELETVFNSGDEFEFSIELSDTAGTNGTTFTWSGAVVGTLEIDPNSDGEVGAKFTVSPGGKPTVTPAA